jgi:hypothetical protein
LGQLLIVVPLLVVSFVCHWFKPIDGLFVEHFRDSNMHHANLCGRTVPVLLSDFEEDNIARPHLFDRSTFSLNQAEALDDDDRLASRVCVPTGAGARLEGNDSTVGVPASIRRKKRIDANVAGEPVSRADH